MPIQTVCPNCAKTYNLADAMQGKNVKCKNCTKVFVVEPAAAKKTSPVPPKTTGPSPASTTGPIKAAPKKTAPKPADDEIMAVLPVDDDDDAEEARPVRKGAKKAAAAVKPKSGNMMWLLLAGGGGVGFLLLLACMGGLWYMLGSGLSQSLNETTYDKLKRGMTEAQVIDILGKPTETLDSNTAAGLSKGLMQNMKSMSWTQTPNSITVTFRNGKAEMIAGQFKDANGITTLRLGTKADQVALGQPPPPSPPPQIPPPSTPPAVPLVVQPPQSFPPPPTPPVPPPTTPPAPLPPPKTPPAPTPPAPTPPVPPPAPSGPSKITKADAAVFAAAVNKNGVLQLATILPPTTQGKATKAPNGKAATELWTWHNGKGYMKIYFDKFGNVVEHESKDLP